MNMRRARHASLIVCVLLGTLSLRGSAAAAPINISPIVYSGGGSDVQISTISYSGTDSTIQVSKITYPGPQPLKVNPGSLRAFPRGETGDSAEPRGKGFLAADSGEDPAQVFGRRNLVTNAFSILSPRQGGSYMSSVTIRVILPERRDLTFRLARDLPNVRQWDPDWKLWEVPASELVDKGGYFQWEKVFSLEPNDYYLIARPKDPTIPLGESAKDKVEFKVTGFSPPPKMAVGSKQSSLKPEQTLVPQRSTPVMPGKKAAPGAQDPQVQKAGKVALTQKPLVIVKSIGFKPAPLKEGAAVDLLVEFQNAGTAKAAGGLPYTISCRVKSGGPSCPIAASTPTIGKSLEPGETHWVTHSGAEGAMAGSYEVTVEPKPGTKRTEPFSVKGKIKRAPGKQNVEIAPGEEGKGLSVPLQRQKVQ